MDKVNLTMPQMVDEAHRSRRVWMDQYMLMVHHCGAQTRAIAILETTAAHAEVEAAQDVLRAAVQPDRIIPTDPRGKFEFMVDMDLGLDIERLANGNYYDPRVQGMWRFFEAGHLFAMKDRRQQEALS